MTGRNPSYVDGDGGGPITRNDMERCFTRDGGRLVDRLSIDDLASSLGEYNATDGLFAIARALHRIAEAIDKLAGAQ